MERFNKLRGILSGETPIKLHLEFLYRNNKSDLNILKKTQGFLEPKSSIHQSALVFSHAFMNAGTTNDDFLRKNLDWLGKANNWAKFSATATLGVIHKGQLKEGFSLLKPYLPKEGVNSSPYSEGGSLFALGLISAKYGHGVIDYLLKSLKSTQNEVVQHGACLGLGVSAMGSDDKGKAIERSLSSLSHL